MKVVLIAELLLG